ncbi:hypothetical protein DPMN_124977, partial [Dreissena polymorpha]
VTAGFTFEEHDWPLVLYMNFETPKATIDALINGGWLWNKGENKVQAFTGSVTSQNTITLEVDHTGLTHIYLDGVKITDFRHHLTDVRRSNKFFVSGYPDVRLTRLEFKRLP